MLKSVKLSTDLNSNQIMINLKNTQKWATLDMTLWVLSQKYETPFQGWWVVHFIYELGFTFSGMGRSEMNRIQTTFKFYQGSCLGLISLPLQPVPAPFPSSPLLSIPPKGVAHIPWQFHTQASCPSESASLPSRQPSETEG